MSSWLQWQPQALAFPIGPACTFFFFFGGFCRLFVTHPRYQTLQRCPPGWPFCTTQKQQKTAAAFPLAWHLWPWCSDMQGDGSPGTELLPQPYPLEHLHPPGWPQPFPGTPQKWLPHTSLSLPWCWETCYMPRARTAQRGEGQARPCGCCSQVRFAGLLRHPRAPPQTSLPLPSPPRPLFSWEWNQQQLLKPST